MKILINTFGKMVPAASGVLIFPKARKRKLEQLGSNCKCQEATQNKTSGGRLHAATSLETTSKTVRKAARHPCSLKPMGVFTKKKGRFTREQPETWAGTLPVTSQGPTQGTLAGATPLKPSRTGQRRQGQLRVERGRAKNHRQHLSPRGRGTRQSQQIFKLPPPEVLKTTVHTKVNHKG